MYVGAHMDYPEGFTDPDKKKEAATKEQFIEIAKIDQ